MWHCKKEEKRNAKNERKIIKKSMLSLVFVNMLAIKWYDKRKVFMISTIHTEELADI